MNQHTTRNADHCAVIVTALPVEYHTVRANLADILEDVHPEWEHRFNSLPNSPE